MTTNARISECRDCKATVSREARHCPHCGCEWPNGQPVDFFESNRRASLRHRTNYKFGRSLVNAIVILWAVFTAFVLGSGIFIIARDGWEKLHDFHPVLFGYCAGALLFWMLIAQLVHAVFDIADAAVEKR